MHGKARGHKFVSVRVWQPEAPPEIRLATATLFAAEEELQSYGAQVNWHDRVYEGLSAALVLDGAPDWFAATKGLPDETPRAKIFLARAARYLSGETTGIRSVYDLRHFLWRMRYLGQTKERLQHSLKKFGVRS